MQMIPVVSGNIKAIGYDLATHTLRVEFHNGGLYDYPNMPISIYIGLKNANSHGQYFAAYVKHRPFKKLR